MGVFEKAAKNKVRIEFGPLLCSGMSYIYKANFSKWINDKVFRAYYRINLDNLINESSLEQMMSDALDEFLVKCKEREEK